MIEYEIRKLETRLNEADSSQVRFLRIWRKNENRWRVVAGTITMLTSRS